jgi:hypothetical protein
MHRRQQQQECTQQHTQAGAYYCELHNNRYCFQGQTAPAESHFQQGVGRLLCNSQHTQAGAVDAQAADLT